MTTRAVLCTPLRLERTAVGRDSPAVRRMRTGMGPERSATASLGAEPVIVAGVAGGLTDAVAPGDLVVATEVRSGEHRIELPSARLLAAELRRAGLTVHLGPILSTDHIVDGAERAELAATGAVAIDMESYPLVAAAGGAPTVVVRSIVDTPRHPLRRPGTVVRGFTALRALRAARPALDRWAAATGPREILLANPRSFCAGVRRAIEIVDRALERRGAPVYVRRQIVHNTHVVAELEARGAVFVTEVDEVPEGQTVVLAAHGVAPAVRADAADRGLSVIDATCPLVTKVHNEVRRYAGRGDTIFLIGHADHEEVEGTRGEAPADVIVVEDAENARRVQPRDPQQVAYTMQTTLAVDEGERIAAILRERFPALQGPHRDDICFATTNRQRALLDICSRADLVLVVGSENSSNSKRLVEVSQRAGTPARLIDDVSGIELETLAGVRSVGLTAGASAPPRLVDDVLTALAGLGPVNITDEPLIREDITFTFPREVS